MGSSAAPTLEFWSFFYLTKLHWSAITSIHPFSMTTHTAFLVAGPQHEINCIDHALVDFIDLCHQRSMTPSYQQSSMDHPIYPSQIWCLGHLDDTWLLPGLFLSRCCGEAFSCWGCNVIGVWQSHWVRMFAVKQHPNESQNPEIFWSFCTTMRWSVLWLLSLYELICLSE